MKAQRRDHLIKNTLPHLNEAALNARGILLQFADPYDLGWKSNLRVEYVLTCDAHIMRKAVYANT